MATTRGGLVPARIYALQGGVSVDCMFNPFEYSVTKSNTYDESPKNHSDVPHAEFKKAGAQALKLALVFDTYESGGSVAKITNKLWKLMEAKTLQQGSTTKKIPPPEVAFEWGVFHFEAFVTNMTQKFTLFDNKGTPVRANVDITFTQYNDKDDYPGQNPTSGGGDVERVWRVVTGDRLDAIAYQVYGEVAKWTLIAERNKIRDPLALRPGMALIVPKSGE
jgi:nucleoid-associated protein YgaU